MKKLFLPVLLLVMALLPMACVSSGSDGRLRAMEARQDSILAILRVMKSQSDFVAQRVGWRPPADTAAKSIPQGSSFSIGPSSAVLTIVEFSDLQCPYCARLTPVIDSVVHAFPRDVRLVYKHFPLSFHAQARAAAAAAIAAGKQGRFFEFRARTVPHFRDLNEGLYLSIARDLNLDMGRFRRDMALTDEVNALLDADIELGRSVGVEGTPTLFVNGRLAEDRSFDYFAGLVAQLKRNR
jgi:protein-disulfide isomerase